MIRKLILYLEAFFKENKRIYFALVIIVLITIAIRFSYQHTYPALEKDIYTDYYANIAESLYNGNGYTIDGEFSAFRGPGYPLFLLLILKVFKGSILWCLFAQCLLEAGTTLLLFFIGKRLFKSNFISLLLSCLYAIFIPQVAVLTILASEYFFTFLITLSFFLYTYTEKNKIWNLIYGISIGLVTITRPEGIYFFYMIVLFNIFLRKYKPILFQSIGLSIILAPWLIFSSIHLGGFNKMDQLAGYNLINKNYVLANKGFFNVTRKTEIFKEYLKVAFEDRGLNINDYPGIWGHMELYDKIGKEEFFKLVKQHPAKFTYLLFAKFVHHSCGIQLLRDPLRIDLEYMVFQIPLILLFFIGLWKMIKSKKDIILLMVVYLILMFGIRVISNPAPKNMIGNIPTLLILAIWYITNSKLYKKIIE